MKIKQLSVFIENAPGRLFQVAQALGEAGINIRALQVADVGEFGVLRLLVSDVTQAIQILMAGNMPARVDEVVAVEIDDHTGRFGPDIETASGRRDQYQLRLWTGRGSLREGGHDLPAQRP